MHTYHGQVARMLHEEHVAVIDLLQRLTSLLERHRPGLPPDMTANRALFNALATAIETEVKTHFEFEESTLFPLLNQNGERELSDLYIEEHRAIAPLGAKIAQNTRAALGEGFDTSRWAAFHPCALEFADRLTRHAESEEAALIPLLDELLDTDEDDRLAQRYEAIR